jgi:hypothetical protein
LAGGADGSALHQLGTLGRYWRLLLKNHATDLDALTHLRGQIAKGHIKCDRPLPADLDRLFLDPPPRPPGSSRTLNPPRIWIRADVGPPIDASDFKAWLHGSEAGAYGIDDNPLRRSPPATAIGSGPPPWVSPHDREKLEEQRRHNELIREQNDLTRAVLEQRAREKAPSAEPEPQQSLKAVDPKDRAALLQWVRETVKTQGWPRDKHGLPKALLVAWVNEGRPIPANVKESSFRAALGRCARSSKRMN